MEIYCGNGAALQIPSDRRRQAYWWSTRLPKPPLFFTPALVLATSLVPILVQVVTSGLRRGELPLLERRAGRHRWSNVGKAATKVPNGCPPCEAAVDRTGTVLPWVLLPAGAPGHGPYRW